MASTAKSNEDTAITVVVALWAVRLNAATHSVKTAARCFKQVRVRLISICIFHLMVLGNVLNADEGVQSNANSLQSGLISVVLKGNDNFFELPRAKDFYLELEDVAAASPL